MGSVRACVCVCVREWVVYEHKCACEWAATSHFLYLFFRFDVGSKNAILLHDIEISKLFGVDFEKIKSIARAETTVAKIHSSTVTLPPLHLLYTR